LQNYDVINFVSFFGPPICTARNDNLYFTKQTLVDKN